MKLFNKDLVTIEPCGQLQLISKKIREITESRFLHPTPEHPNMGICNTCDPNRKRFMVDLMDLDNTESCFMLNHDVESIAGLPWQQNRDFLERFGKEIEDEAGL